MRSTGASPARGEVFRRDRPLACQSFARRGQAPDVTEQNQHQGTLICNPDFAQATQVALRISNSPENDTILIEATIPAEPVCRRRHQ
jgi:hypothetical protein